MQISSPMDVTIARLPAPHFGARFLERCRRKAPVFDCFLGFHEGAGFV
jgi:hypothetical protein